MSNLPCIRSLLLLSFTTVLANAASNGLLLGTDAPPAAVGGYSLTPFLPDLRPEFSAVQDVSSPLGGRVGLDLSPDLARHLVVPNSWGSWSHGYKGDVYAPAIDAVGSSDFSVTLTLPADTTAFVVYAQPLNFGLFDISAKVGGGPVITSPVEGDGGAFGFAFYADPGDTLGPITIFSSSAFAVGEFSIANCAVPEVGGGAAGWLLVAVAGGSLLRRRTRA